MRWQAVIVLLAIAVGAIVPPSFNLTIGHDCQAELGTLDLCHSGTPAISANGDMPCMKEGSYLPLPPARAKVHAEANSPVNPASMAFQDERPPEA